MEVVVVVVCGCVGSSRLSGGVGGRGGAKSGGRGGCKVPDNT